MPGIIREFLLDNFFEYPDELFSLYIMTFAGPPYYEAFRYSELLEMSKSIWFSARDSLILSCREAITKRLIGFFVGYNLLAEEDICSGLIPNFGEFVPADYFYMSEAVTHPEFRQKGVATVLVQTAIKMREGSYKKFILRTNVDNSIALGLYRKVGFNNFKVSHEKIQHSRVDGSVSVDERLFLILDKTIYEEDDKKD